MKNIRKYKNVISYLFFGICTTAINVIVYYTCFSCCGIPNIGATIIAWLLSVLFAFFTNKIFVFESKSFLLKLVLDEFAKFISARALTGCIDVIIMYIAVDINSWNATIWKLISNIIIIILNYIISKIFIFKKK